MSVLAVVVDRDVVTVTGPDAAAYLQGQLSQDVEALEPGESVWSFALQPQGKVDAWLRLTRTAADSFALDVDHGHGEALLARLQRFLLRTRAELTVASVPMVAVRGGAEVEVPEGARALDPAWPGLVGIDLLGTEQVPQGVRSGSSDELEHLRIEAGVPAMGAELTEATIPAESGVVERSVSFTKGCFTGQELVARIDSRGGNVPRHLRLLEVEGAEPVAVGAEVVIDGKVVGTVTSSAPATDGEPPVALAYVGRAVEPPASGTVAGVDVRIEALPRP